MNEKTKLPFDVAHVYQLCKVHFCIDIERTNFNKIKAMQEPFQNSLVHCYLFLNELYAGYVRE